MYKNKFESPLGILFILCVFLGLGVSQKYWWGPIAGVLFGFVMLYIFRRKTVQKLVLTVADYIDKILLPVKLWFHNFLDWLKVLSLGAIALIVPVILFIIGILVIGNVFGSIGNLGKYEGLTAEEWFIKYDGAETKLENSEIALEEANNALEETNNTIEDYKTALNEANDNIDEANSKINRAKICAWGCSYEDMQAVLYNLKKVDTVSEP